MNMTLVDYSTNIHSRGYDPRTMVLRVCFLDKKTGGPGPVYDYGDVPITLWNEWLDASSAGSFFFKNIKGKFSVEKVG